MEINDIQSLQNTKIFQLKIIFLLMQLLEGFQNATEKIRCKQKKQISEIQGMR